MVFEHHLQKPYEFLRCSGNRHVYNRVAAGWIGIHGCLLENEARGRDVVLVIRGLLLRDHLEKIRSG